MAESLQLGEPRADRSGILEASDAEIERAVMAVDSMAARGLLYQLTGDEELASVELSAVRVGFLPIKDVAKPEDVDLIRARLADFLKAYRDGGAGDISFGPADRLPRSLTLTCGDGVAPDEVEMWAETLALDPWTRAAGWSNPGPPERREDFTVVVIGAGLSGLNAAAYLRRLGLNFTVLERNSGVGGVWHENSYPGCRVDTQSRTYTHLIGVTYPLASTYCVQPENEKYLNWLTDTMDIRRAMEFDTEVKSIVWDDDAELWQITATGPGGTRSLRANAIINATGVFSTPNTPDIAGEDTFRGLAVHTARWPSGLDLTGKRVAVVGTGCTGYQMFPEIAEVAEHAYLFQRKPNWVFDTPGYLDDFPPEVSWLDRNVPYYTNFLRFRQAWLYRPDAIRKTFATDPDYAGPGPSELNDEIRAQRLAFIRSKLGHRPDLMEKMTPEAPPMSARPIRSDLTGGIYDALLRDNVTLVSDPIARLTEDRLVTADGAEHPVDVVIYATGFRASAFLWPMEVRGRGGRRLDDLWAKDGARAYLGTMLPGFPNFFMLYGPNTNPVSGLGVIDSLEMTTRFALSCLAHLIEEDKSFVDVTYEGYARYNERLDELDAHSVYHDPRAQNYYENEYGRGAVNNPFDVRLMWRWLRDPRDSGSQEEATGEAASISPYFGADLLVE